MANKSYLQIIFLLIVVSFLDFSLFGMKKRTKPTTGIPSRTDEPGSQILKFIADRGPGFAKQAAGAVAPGVVEKFERHIFPLKEQEKQEEQEKSLKDRIQSRKNIEEKKAEKAIKITEPEILDDDLKKRIQSAEEVKKLELLETRRASLEKARKEIEAKILEKKDANPAETEKKLSEVKESEENLKEEFNKKLGTEETEDESGGLSGAKKTVLTTLATAAVGGLATGTTSASAGALFAGAQALQGDDEDVFLDTEEAGDDETILEDEVQDEEEITQESATEKAVKIVVKEPAGSIIGELISGAKEVAGDIVETAAISMATGEQKEGMLEKVKEDEKREAAEKQDKTKKQEKKSSFVQLDSGTSADKKVKKKPVEEKKVDEKKDKQEKIAAKEEVLKVISLPEDMELTSKQAESLLSILADHAGKVLKKSSKLFSNDEKKKTFTTVSGETIGVVGKDFSKEYIDKYQSTLDLYKKARDEYKALLKGKKAGKVVDEDQLASNKRYYEEMKDKARTAFIEKRNAINNKALYYQPNGSASALKIIQEGVKIIQKHTPGKLDEIDLLKIFTYLKPLDIESKDILPIQKGSEKSQDDQDIEKELFTVTKRLDKEKRDVEERLSKEKANIEMLRKKREHEFEAVEKRLKKEQEDTERRRQEADKELEEFGERKSFWN